MPIRNEPGGTPVAGPGVTTLADESMGEDMPANAGDKTLHIVAFGGGTGMSHLLSGLKHFSSDITAVVTVADDGGSSGRLRKDFDMLPPGDIRSCLVALATAEPLMSKLFQYRFEESDDLKGHSFGNLLITALTRLTGDFGTAIREANKILAVRGRVLPSTLKKVALVATHEDGSKSTGEQEISKSHKPIRHMELKPDPGEITEETKSAILDADLIILGPGSLYTSVIPNLLVHGMSDAVAASRACKVYVCNVMTQAGETDDHTVADHAEAVCRNSSDSLIEYVIANTGSAPEKLLERYAKEGSYSVHIDRERIAKLGFKLIEKDVINTQNFLRHDSDKLAEAIISLVDGKGDCS